MVKRWVKEEVKRNEIAILFEKIIKFIREKQDAAIMIGIVILAVVVFVPVIINQNVKRNKEAFMLFHQGESLLYAGKIEQSLKIFDNLNSRFPDTVPGILGKMSKADLSFERENFEEALKIYLSFKNNKKAKPFLPQILINIGKIYEDMDKNRSALNIYNEFLNRFDMHYLAPEALFGKVRMLLRLKDYKEAGNTLNIIISRYAGTKWEEIAKGYQKKKKGN